MTERRSFGRDLILLMFLVSGIALLFAALIWLMYQALSGYSRAVDQVARDAASIIPQTIESVILDKPEVAESALGLIVARGENDAAAIYLPDGSLFVSRLAKQAAPVPAVFQGKHGTQMHDTSLVHVAALIRNNRHIGTLYLRTSLHAEIEQFLYNIAVGVIVVGLVFMFAMFVALRLQRRIAAPIENLITTARAASDSDDYSIRVNLEHSEHTELSELVNAFNALLIKIDSSHQELEKSTQYYKLIIDHAADSIFVHDVRGRILDVNEHACKTLGYSRAEMLNMSVSDFETLMRVEVDDPLANPQLKGSKGIWRQLVNAEISTSTVNGEQRRKDGSTLHVEVRLTTIKAHNTTCILALARDMTEHQIVKTELQAAKIDAEDASQVKSQFLANMSHEIRTPMNAVIGLTDLLMETILTRRQREYVQTIRNSGDLLLSVIDDILDFSKLDAGISLHVDEFKIEDVIGGVIDILGYAAHSRHLELICQFDPRLSEYSVLGDSVRLRQILMNLVGNAVKFTDRGHVLLQVETISESEDDMSLEFQVSDTGIGFNESEKQNIFTPFTQIDTSTKRKHMGTGLGLPITKHLIELMDGTIDVTSKPGHGSTFWFTICFEKVEQAKRAENPLQGLHVMIVDRYPLVTKAAAKQLRALGMHPTAVNDSSTVIEMLAEAEQRQQPYQLILLDADSGPVDGISLARQIRADERIGEIGLIITSSIARPMKPSVINSVSRALCISKPLLPAALREACIEATVGSPAERLAHSTRGDDYHGSCEDLRTIVVEDNPVSREMLLKMLTVYSCDADSAADGAEALIRAAEGNYSLMLLDCQMPEMDGYEVVSAIRQRESEAQVDDKLVIIAVTANASLADQTRCLDLGFNDYLPKPVRLLDLEKILGKWFPERFIKKGAAQKTPAAIDAEPEKQLAPRQEAPVNQAAWQCFIDEPEKLNKLFHLFMDDAESGVEDIRSLIAEGDQERLARAAHALKSGCLQIGAETMADHCKKIEQSDSMEESSKYLSLIEAEFVRIQEFLTEILNKGLN